MTAIASPHREPSGGTRASPSPTAPPSYANAHWYFLAAFGVILAGFWPTFFRPVGSGTPTKNLHGITASLWYFGLMLQSWLISRGMVTWHRRVARGIVLLLPVLCVSALSNTRIFLATSTLPPPVTWAIAFFDFQITLQLVVLVVLGIINRHTPAAHKRFMAATIFAGFPPALGRLYPNLGLGQYAFFADAFYTIDVILLVLIAVDWRNGERRLAYPLMLLWTIAIQLVVGPVSSSSWWLAFCNWFAAARA